MQIKIIDTQEKTLTVLCIELVDVIEVSPAPLPEDMISCFDLFFFLNL